MNCVELQNGLAEIENGGSAEQRAHLRSCEGCSALLAELEQIARTAVTLRAADEPSPRVWNSIEIALRQEGLIHPPRTSRSLLPSLSSPWRWARWLVPAAAALLIVIGLYVRQQSLSRQLAKETLHNAPVVVSDAEIAGLDDADLLAEIASQAPALREQYTDNLRRVNQSIVDAKGSVADNPNDDEARRSLLEAYQQKAMLFELAMDRSLP